MNKRKILEAARKHAQKGAKDKSLKEYQKLLALDPRDAKLRLEVGDAHRRWGQVDEAVAAYAKVAEQYMNDGFDARAVAVYKQIQNLAPARYDCYESLADLYQRMGLTAEAINTLQMAADGHHREGRKREALELLRKMANIDPTNTTSRIKVADLLRQEGLSAEASAEYREVAAEFERRGNVEALGTVLERILEVEPDSIPVIIQLANNLVGRSLADRAEPFAKRALEADPNEPDSYELLAQVYRLQNRGDDLIGVYRRLAELYDRRGDSERARDIRQRFIPPDGFSPETSGAEDLIQREPLGDEPLSGDVSEFLEESTLVGYGSRLLQDSKLAAGGSAAPPEEALDRDVSELLDDEFLAGESPAAWEGEGDIGAGDLAGPPSDLESPTGEHRVQSELIQKTVVSLDQDQEVDPEQILAEASVYLRYGKQERAIESLERLLELDPRHRNAMEKLGDAFAASKQNERAVEVWLRAAKRAREDGDEAAVGVLRDRIAALDEGAAAGLGPEPTLGGDDDSEQYLDVSQPVVPALESEDVPSPDAAEEDLGDDLGAAFDIDDIELDVDPSDLEDEGGRGEVDPGLEGAEADSSMEVEDESTEVEVRTAAAPAAGPATQEEAGGSSSAAIQIGEDLEEADFYMQQGLVEEAEAVYQRLLKLAPNHPLVLVRLGEIAASRGQDPAAAGRAEAAEQGAPEVEPLAGEGPSPQDLDVADDSTDLDLAEPPAPPAVEEAPPAPAAPEEAAPAATEIAPLEGAPPVASEIAVPEEDTGVVAPAETSGPEESAGVAAEAGTSAPPQSQSGFDLAAALSDAFEEDSDDSSGSGLSGADEDGFAAVFNEFKKGVSKTLSEGDHEAHYDLGIAYREMGLLEDAMGEFRASMGSPALQIDSLHMLGLCAIDVGQPQDAVAHLQQALAQPDATQEQQLAACFELGRAFEILGDGERARGAYETVAAIDPLFCDVEERLSQLDGGAKSEEESGGAQATGPEESEFESFDDVIEEANADRDRSEADTTMELLAYESAEDEEDSASEPETEPDGTDEPEPTAAPEPELPPAPPRAPGSEAESTSEPRRRGKKKISFV